MIHPSFQKNIPQIISIFKKYKLESASFFGSITTNNFNENSDLDILIKLNSELLDPLEKGKLMWDLQFEIEDTFCRKVDLLQESTPKNEYFIKELNESKQLIYEQ